EDVAPGEAGGEEDEEEGTERHGGASHRGGVRGRSELDVEADAVDAAEHVAVGEAIVEPEARPDAGDDHAEAEARERGLLDADLVAAAHDEEVVPGVLRAEVEAFGVVVRVGELAEERQRVLVAGAEEVVGDAEE